MKQVNAELTTDNEYLAWVVCQITSRNSAACTHHICKWLSKCAIYQQSSIGNHLKDTLGIVCKHRRYETLCTAEMGLTARILFQKHLVVQKVSINKSEAYIRQKHSLVLIQADWRHYSSGQFSSQCTNENMQFHCIVQTYQNDHWLCGLSGVFRPGCNAQQLDPLLVQILMCVSNYL